MKAAPSVNRVTGRSHRTSSTVRRRIYGILREPLIHFIAIGILLLALQHYYEARSQRYVINLGPAEIQRIAIGYARQYGAAPSPEVMRALTDDYVRQEVLLREGLALGLDINDEIVRRRIAQKFEFLMQDRISAREPTDVELEQWFQRHRGRYAIPPQRSFEHRYFAIDRRGDHAAHQIALSARETLRAGKRAPAGDVFPGPPVNRLLSGAEIDRLFGGEGFSASIFVARANVWSGPYRSSFGWHVIRVTEDEPEQVRDLAAVRDEVISDWKQADRASLNRAAFDEILARYRVVEEKAPQ